MGQGANKEDDNLASFPPDFSDLDLSFTSSSASTFGASSARSSLSLSLPSFSSSSTLKPLPHRRSDPHWSALRAAANLSANGSLHLRHLKLLRLLGSGNLARVFHCRLRGFDYPFVDFALKVVDLQSAATATDDEAASMAVGGGKLSNVRTEARVLASLDHPFLPTLYARLDASHYACFLIDYCPGGDLHSLLRRRHGHRLPLAAVRFYAAEVLLALEYLHALGFVYRDLKPENVLLRADGHVMLSDFDLCFQSEVAPSLHRRLRQRRRPSLSSFCFLGADKEEEELEFVAEPETAFSLACVGTHEYLSPEVVAGAGHGNCVDWWALGIFIYELLYGRTPFKGGSKESTLKNILARELKFPETSVGDDGGVGAAARDLISRLLVRDPRRRMGSVKGAAEIKRHPFFDGVQWPLMRMMKPPVVVGASDAAGARVSREGKRWWSWKWSSCDNKVLKLRWLVDSKKKAR